MKRNGARIREAPAAIGCRRLVGCDERKIISCSDCSGLAADSGCSDSAACSRCCCFSWCAPPSRGLSTLLLWPDLWILYTGEEISVYKILENKNNIIRIRQAAG